MGRKYFLFNLFLLSMMISLLFDLMDVIIVMHRYILEGKELEFYMKKIQRKKGKGAGAAA